jgi:hypothetical protein
MIGLELSPLVMLEEEPQAFMPEAFNHLAIVKRKLTFVQQYTSIGALDRLAGFFGSLTPSLLLPGLLLRFLNFPVTSVANTWFGR